MRVLTGLILGLATLAMGFWAYQENYRTRAAQAELRQLQADLVRLNETLAILRAEWAWLNRPERLQALVLANKAQLELMDMSPDHFGHLDQVAYPIARVLLRAPEDGVVRVSESEEPSR